MSDFEYKEGELIININPKVYSLDMVYATAYAYLDRYYFLFDGNPDTEIVVKVSGKKKNDIQEVAKLQWFGNEFMNELISISNYFKQLELNKDVVNAVLQRALFSAAPKLVEQAEEEEINKILAEVEKDVNLS